MIKAKYNSNNSVTSGGEEPVPITPATEEPVAITMEGEEPTSMEMTATTMM